MVFPCYLLNENTCNPASCSSLGTKEPSALFHPAHSRIAEEMHSSGAGTYCKANKKASPLSGKPLVESVEYGKRELNLGPHLHLVIPLVFHRWNFHDQRQR